MTEIEFQEHYLDKIKAALSFVMNNKYSDFYRKKYANLNFDVTKITTYEQFKKIPILTKEELLEVPLEDRCFVPTNKIVRYTMSTGTTKTRKPLYVPHAVSFNTYPMSKNIYLSEEVVSGKTFVVVTPPMASTTILQIKRLEDNGAIAILGDIHNIPRTSMMINDLPIDGIVTSQTGLSLITKELEELQFDFKRIKIISLGSEMTTSKKFTYFKNKFPNAKFFFRFGASETELRGFRCQQLFDKAPNIYHPTAWFPEINEDGLLIYTDMTENKALPLIRFQTDDLAEIIQKPCPCGERLELHLGGKNNINVLKFDGMILYSELVENIIDEYISKEQNGQKLSGNFNILVDEILTRGTFKPQLTIKIETKLQDQSLQNTLSSSLEKYLSKKLLLSSGKTLENLVKDGHLLPLKLELVDKISSDYKTKHITSSLN